MAKSKEAPKPIYPLRHAFVESLDRYLHETGMLADAVKQALELGLIKPPGDEILRERLAAVQSIRHGEE